MDFKYRVVIKTHDDMPFSYENVIDSWIKTNLAQVQLASESRMKKKKNSKSETIYARQN